MNPPDGDSESAYSQVPEASPPVPVFDAVVVHNPIPAQPGPPPGESVPQHLHGGVPPQPHAGVPAPPHAGIPAQSRGSGPAWQPYGGAPAQPYGGVPAQHPQGGIPAHQPYGGAPVPPHGTVPPQLHDGVPPQMHGAVPPQPYGAVPGQPQPGFPAQQYGGVPQQPYPYGGIPSQAGPPAVENLPPGYYPPPPYGVYPPPWAVPPAPKKRHRGMIAAAAVVVTILAGAAVASYPELIGADADAAAAPAVSAPPASPAANALSYERVPWIRSQIDASLQAQATALLAGDEPGFLSPVAEGDAELTRDLRRRFEALRAMQVTGWVEKLIGSPTPVTGKGGRDEWLARVDLQHCFVVAGCVTDGLRAETRWIETPSDGLRMVAFDASASEENGPRPWEVTDLTVAVGARTIVGVTPKYAKRLPELQKQAEAAALLADRYVRGDAGPVDRYRIFMADGKEWQRWYGGEDLEWAAGYAVPTGEARLEVVLNLSEMPEDYVDDTLRHELAHVATLRGADYSDDADFWWMIEGIADYVDESGVPVADYEEAALVARYVDEVDMTSGVVVPPPDAGTEDWQVAARYGVGYYAVRRIAERFGEPAMLAFFDAVVRNGTPLKDAAPATLGKDWDDVNRDCLDYTKRAT